MHSHFLLRYRYMMISKMTVLNISFVFNILLLSCHYCSSSSALVVPVYTRFPLLFAELQQVLPDVTFHQVNDPETDAHFRNSSIVICDFDKLGPELYKLPNAKWAQGTWAGVEGLIKYYNKSKPVNYQVTRYSGDNFGKLMSEYVISHIVNFERDFFKVRENQKNAIWDKGGKIQVYRTIFDMTIGIIGFGNIGSRIGRNLNVLGAKIIALGRKPELPKGDEYSFVGKYYTQENLPALLKESDYVINMLPSTPETDDFLDKDVLENCKEKGTVLINIGRANVLSEESLVKALKNKWISGAILDVFDKEPLPKESPLWKMDNVIITPHVAAFARPKDVAKYIKHNFELYDKKLPLPLQVNFTKGY